MLGHPDLREGNLIITSKGLSDQGLAFKDNEANEKNLYIRTFDAQDGLLDALKALAGKKDQPVYVLGETFGAGVQDLHYGLTDTKFLAFDIYIGEPGKGTYLDCIEFMMTAHSLHLDTVPVLYRGPFDRDELVKHRDGIETISGHGDCIREGIVIKPCTERRCDEIGRVVLKWVSPDYLTRRGKKGQELTEFN
jgi:RNA ligase (TIGR02306 family)